MSNSATQLLQKLQRKYFVLRLLEALCIGTAAGVAIFALSIWAGVEQIDANVLALTVGLTVFLWQFYRIGLHQLSLSRMAAYLNRQIPEMQWSAELLIAAPANLSALQKIQRDRMHERLREMPAPKMPHHLLRSVVVLAFASLLLFLLPFLKTANGSVPSNKISPNQLADGGLRENHPIMIDGFSITLNPPAYTGAGVSISEEPNLKLPEGSLVNWKIEFSGMPDEVKMVFSGRDTLALKGAEDSWTLRRQFRQSGFYQVVWSDGAEIRSSDFYKITVTPDAEPKPVVTNLPQFQEFEWTDRLQVPVMAEIIDDYGLTDAYIIATVTKGSGESVKFREEKLTFSEPATVAGRKINARQTIDLQKLGLEPGDELYFYVQAWDNKIPDAQEGRTETYFIQLKDTASYITSADGGLGVDLMPEYFRSQRQIIIDSEKLVGDRGKVKKQEFDNRSNSLAHDQKVLRLRYGQFLGEEFESGMSSNEPVVEEDHEHEVEEVDVLKEYGHAHDTENEHNLVPEETHDHEEARPGEKEDPLEAFAHMHDSEEEATFFVQSVKAKLRAALSLMWDAELHLRMNNPEQSLPFQYKILKLLKEISNDSRIYVHRTGFDPPPIKEDKRLSGDLSEINPSRSTYQVDETAEMPNISLALPIIEALLNAGRLELSDHEREVLAQAGAELAALALEQPGNHLESMSLLKSLMDEELEPASGKQSLLRIRKTFWEVLPAAAPSPVHSARSLHTTDMKLLEQLDKGIDD